MKTRGMLLSLLLLSVGCANRYQPPVSVEDAYAKTEVVKTKFMKDHVVTLGVEPSGEVLYKLAYAPADGKDAFLIDFQYTSNTGALLERCSDDTARQLPMIRRDAKLRPATYGQTVGAYNPVLGRSFPASRIGEVVAIEIDEAWLREASRSGREVQCTGPRGAGTFRVEPHTAAGFMRKVDEVRKVG